MRQTPGRIASQSKRKWLPTSPPKNSSTTKKRRKKRKIAKEETIKENKQQTVDKYFNKKEDVPSAKDNCDHFELPVQLRIKKLEQGYLTDPETEIRRDLGEKKFEHSV